MDQTTINIYNNSSKSFIEKYQAITPVDVHKLISKFFIPRGTTLDIGCASGRDLAFLFEKEFKISGLDATENFVNHCRTMFPASNIIFDHLPTISKVANATYDNVLVSAVLMHLPLETLALSINNIARITKENGIIIISVRDRRDIEPDDRLFTNIPSDKLITIAEESNLNLIRVENCLNSKREISWFTFIFKKKAH